MADKDKEKEEKTRVEKAVESSSFRDIVQALKELADELGAPRWIRWGIPAFAIVLLVIQILFPTLIPEIASSIVLIFNKRSKDVTDLLHKIADNMPEYLDDMESRFGRYGSKVKQLVLSGLDKIEVGLLKALTGVQNYFNDDRRRRWRNFMLWYVGLAFLMIIIGILPLTQLRPLIVIFVITVGLVAFQATRRWALPVLAILLVMVGFTALSPVLSTWLYSGHVQQTTPFIRIIGLIGWFLLVGPLSFIIWLVLKGIGHGANQNRLSQSENWSNLFRIGLFIVLAWLVIGNWLIAVFTLGCFGAVLLFGSFQRITPESIRSTRRVFQGAFGALLLLVMLDQVANYNTTVHRFVYNSSARASLWGANLFDSGREDDYTAVEQDKRPPRRVLADTDLLADSNFAKDGLLTGDRKAQLHAGQIVTAVYDKVASLENEKVDAFGNTYRLVLVPKDPNDASVSQNYGYVLQTMLESMTYKEVKGSYPKATTGVQSAAYQIPAEASTHPFPVPVTNLTAITEDSVVWDYILPATVGNGWTGMIIEPGDSRILVALGAVNIGDPGDAADNWVTPDGWQTGALFSDGRSNHGSWPGRNTPGRCYHLGGVYYRLGELGSWTYIGSAGTLQNNNSQTMVLYLAVCDDFLDTAGNFQPGFLANNRTDADPILGSGTTQGLVVKIAPAKAAEQVAMAVP